VKMTNFDDFSYSRQGIFFPPHGKGVEHGPHPPVQQGHIDVTVKNAATNSYAQLTAAVNPPIWALTYLPGFTVATRLIHIVGPAFVLKTGNWYFYQLVLDDNLPLDDPIVVHITFDYEHDFGLWVFASLSAGGPQTNGVSITIDQFDANTGFYIIAPEADAVPPFTCQFIIDGSVSGLNAYQFAVVPLYETSVVPKWISVSLIPVVDCTGTEVDSSTLTSRPSTDCQSQTLKVVLSDRPNGPLTLKFEYAYDHISSPTDSIAFLINAEDFIDTTLTVSSSESSVSFSVTAAAFSSSFTEGWGTETFYSVFDIEGWTTLAIIPSDLGYLDGYLTIVVPIEST